ncbi:MAG TPA: DUF4386 domain-containing protein [Rhodanobacteraceae bacterium]|nr:DUF4386 domain-containing protein [Rhodanobacteraceae bacterium]
MNAIRNPGRSAGLLYLLLVLIAPYRLLVIPNMLFVHDDAAATARNIATHEMLFRLGMVSDLCCAVLLVFLTLALYRLFEGVDRKLAVLVVILGGVMPALIDFFNVLNDAGALIFARGFDAGFLAAFDKPQRDAFAMLFLRLHYQVILGAEILWGLWLFPLGMLAYRSRMLPRFLGVWLILNGFAYLVQSLVGLLLPRYDGAFSNVLLPIQLGEVAFMLWLVVMGVKQQPRLDVPGARGAMA